MNAEVKIDRANLKPLPVGDSEWAEFSQNSYAVDKTLLIKEILDDNTKVALFTRPRRFGKTTAMKMLKAFFEKTPKDTSGAGCPRPDRREELRRRDGGAGRHGRDEARPRLLQEERRTPGCDFTHG